MAGPRAAAVARITVLRRCGRAGHPRWRLSLAADSGLAKVQTQASPISGAPGWSVSLPPPVSRPRVRRPVRMALSTPIRRPVRSSGRHTPRPLRRLIPLRAPSDNFAQDGHAGGPHGGLAVGASCGTPLATTAPAGIARKGVSPAGVELQLLRADHALGEATARFPSAYWVDEPTFWLFRAMTMTGSAVPGTAGKVLRENVVPLLLSRGSIAASGYSGSSPFDAVQVFVDLHHGSSKPRLLSRRFATSWPSSGSPSWRPRSRPVPPIPTLRRRARARRSLARRW